MVCFRLLAVKRFRFSQQFLTTVANQKLIVIVVCCPSTYVHDSPWLFKNRDYISGVTR